jgi:hypothetical protein
VKAGAAGFKDDVKGGAGVATAGAGGTNGTHWLIARRRRYASSPDVAGGAATISSAVGGVGVGVTEAEGTLPDADGADDVNEESPWRPGLVDIARRRRYASSPIEVEPGPIAGGASLKAFVPGGRQEGSSVSYRPKGIS